MTISSKVAAGGLVHLVATILLGLSTVVPSLHLLDTAPRWLLLGIFGTLAGLNGYRQAERNPSDSAIRSAIEAGLVRPAETPAP